MSNSFAKAVVSQKQGCTKASELLQAVQHNMLQAYTSIWQSTQGGLFYSVAVGVGVNHSFIRARGAKLGLPAMSSFV